MKIRKIVDYEIQGIGWQIKQARLLSPLSATDLASRAGMSTANWYRIESEKTSYVPEDTLRAIEAALGIDLGLDDKIDKK